MHQVSCVACTFSWESILIFIERCILCCKFTFVAHLKIYVQIDSLFFWCTTTQWRTATQVELKKLQYVLPSKMFINWKLTCIVNLQLFTNVYLLRLFSHNYSVISLYANEHISIVIFVQYVSKFSHESKQFPCEDATLWYLRTYCIKLWISLPYRIACAICSRKLQSHKFTRQWIFQIRILLVK